MDFSRNDFLSIDTIVGSVATMLDDEATKKIHKGRYVSFAQRALQELSFDTFFNKKRMDFIIPQSLRIELPPGTFSVAEVYVFNGSECNIKNAQKLWYKENYFTHGNGFLAKNRGSQETKDPFYPSDGKLVRSQETHNLIRREGEIAQEVLYYSVENGILMVSSAALRWQKLHVVASGSICPIGEAPLVPPIFREVVEDFVCEAACRQLMPRDPQIYVGLQREYKARLDYDGMYGSWHKAKNRIKRMSAGQRADWGEYYSRWSW
jgi:hypothetical protein